MGKRFRLKSNLGFGVFTALAGESLAQSSDQPAACTLPKSSLFSLLLLPLHPREEEGGVMGGLAKSVVGRLYHDDS